MTPVPKTKRPLSGHGKAGAEQLTRLGLNTELPTSLETAGLDGLADLATSAHAPFSRDGARLNIACPNGERRRFSRETIRQYIEQAARFPNVKLIVCHAAPKVWYARKDGALQQTGEYALLIEGLRELADAAATHGLDLVMENNRAYYHDEFPLGPGRADGPSDNFYIGTAPEEWRLIARDVDRDNFGLCLDTSHASTFCHLFPADERAAVLMRYLAEPELIRHVHWSDSLLHDEAGRKDMHLCVGEGTLPAAAHRAILDLDATILLEHFYDVPRLEKELEFISRL